MNTPDPMRDWLTGCARQRRPLLGTPESFSREILDDFLENAPEYTNEEPMIDGRPNIPDTTVKSTHHFGDVRQLIEGSRSADAFIDLDGHELRSRGSAQSRYEFSQTHGVVTLDTLCLRARGSGRRGGHPGGDVARRLGAPDDHPGHPCARVRSSGTSSSVDRTS